MSISRNRFFYFLVGIVSLFILFVFSLSTMAFGSDRSSWVVTYSDQDRIEAFDPFDLVILDSTFHPPLRSLEDRGKTLLGYISLGEVENNRPYFQEAKGEGIVLEESKNWPGSFFIDVREKSWTKRVIEVLIPDILRQGFHGLFLDTLDNPPHLEREQPEKFSGMTKAATRLVTAIRYHYPHILIMMNRGYELLPHVGGQIDMVLGEAVYAGYDFSTKQNHRVDEEEYRSQVGLLQKAKRDFPKLAVYTLDYWDPKDRQGVEAIYTIQRNNGFFPYVSTVQLDRIISKP
jgi:polysaccharide biosynthesis protein PelA